MKKIILMALAALALAGCKGNTKVLLPNVSGKAGEIIVVMEKAMWEGSLGTDAKNLLCSECPYLVPQEPLYSVANVTPSGFADLFKVHRNIVLFSVGPQVDSSSILYQHDVWAAPQCVVQINAKTPEDASCVLKSNGKFILNAFEQAERDRVIANSIRYEERIIGGKIGEVFGGSPHFPSGYKFKKLTENFAWIADEKQYTMQGVFIYRYPASGKEPFSIEEMKAHRNAILKENVPGMFDGTYMTTSQAIDPSVEYFRYKGRHVAELRGYWEVQGDYMGGPFVCHSFYSADGSDIIVLDAFVYAPKYDKRQYLRQVESILYSWDWAEKKE